ncbi:MAG: hypothetical protein ACREJU_07250 [Nitrospiraceae bacterium]
MKFVIFSVFGIMIASGCSFNQWYEPSLGYLKGEGYYSEEVSRAQFQEARAVGKIKERGRFSDRTGGCFNYTDASVDRNIVIPIVQKKLTDLDANVAEKITAISALELNPLVYWVVGIWGCSFWTVAGNAVAVESK